MTVAIVTREMLEAFIAANPDPKAIAKKPLAERFTYEGATFSLASWLAERLPDAKERDWSEGRKWIVPVCPFNEQHDRGEAFVVQRHSGMIGAGCQHDSCTWGWQDLRAKLEPAYAERRERSQAGTKSNRSDREPPPDLDGEVVYEDASYASIEAEIDRQANADRDPPKPDAPKWLSGIALAEKIWAHKDDPWIALKLGDETLCEVRVGGTVVEIGGPGSGKSSLSANLGYQHARDVGVTIFLSIELPVEELAARIVGIQCDAKWGDALRGYVNYEHVYRALNQPRLYVIDRSDASLKNLSACIAAAKAEHPGAPILVVIDYVQLLKSGEREMRLRVADVFEQIDRILRDEKAVGLVLSQMGRLGAKSARSGEAIGTDAAELGAESSAIERFATTTLTIGLKGEPAEDQSQAVELSIGKQRMGQGDSVIPMRYHGHSGLWRIDGEAESATKVREKRDTEKTAKRERATTMQIVGFFAKSEAPRSRNDVIELIGGRKKDTLKAIAELLLSGELVEVARRAPRSRSWMISTPDRAATLGLELVRDMAGTESSHDS